MAKEKPVIFSGIQPTGVIHLGNYMGAVLNFVKLQHSNDCLFCVVDMHAITIRKNPAELRKSCYSLLSLYMACGLDPDVCTLYFQSHVPAHAELSWVLDCYAYIGELSRMTQFKDKSQKHSENINMGLMNYPVLMAADILLYDTDRVPVGEDQRQHMELTRDIAERFNGIYGDVFTVPEAYIPKEGARIKSLSDPTAKMSKSDEENSFISLADTPEVIRRKFKRAVTDSEGGIYPSADKPGVSNLLTILSVCTERPVEAWVNELSGKGYGALKETVADAVIERLRPIQEEYARLMADKAYLSQVAAKGAANASAKAARMLSKVYRKVGLAPKSL